jgi:hypothetical protein
VRYFTIVQHHSVDIVHIDENMTRLIDFHGLGSTFSDRMRTKGFAIFQHTTAELAKFLSFGQHQKLPRCFQNPNKKDKF